MRLSTRPMSSSASAGSTSIIKSMSFSICAPILPTSRTASIVCHVVEGTRFWSSRISSMSRPLTMP
jgi:hypothetical protein